MTRKLWLLCGLTTAALQIAPCGFAQGRGGGGRMMMEHSARWQMLSEAERTKFRAAHERAMQDPQVRAAHERLIQARREFREVMRPALIRADPSLQPVLERLRAQRGGHD